MKLSKKGAAFILGYEAIVLKAYRDGGKVWTIGGGHTAAAGTPAPHENMTITLEEAIRIFKRDIAKYEAEVLKAVKVKLEQHEFDALVSFHYNTGAISSGSVDEKLNAYKFTDAMNTLEKYRKDNGKVIEGLEERRKAERKMFEKNDYDLRMMFVYQEYPGEGKSLAYDKLLWDEPVVEETKPKAKPNLPPWGWIILAIVASIAGYFGINLELPQ